MKNDSLESRPEPDLMLFMKYHPEPGPSGSDSRIPVRTQRPAQGHATFLLPLEGNHTKVHNINKGMSLLPSMYFQQ